MPTIFAAWVPLNVRMESNGETRSAAIRTVTLRLTGPCRQPNDASHSTCRQQSGTLHRTTAPAAVGLFLLEVLRIDVVDEIPELHQDFLGVVLIRHFDDADLIHEFAACRDGYGGSHGDGYRV